MCKLNKNQNIALTRCVKMWNETAVLWLSILIILITRASSFLSLRQPILELITAKFALFVLKGTVCLLA